MLPSAPLLPVSVLLVLIYRYLKSGGKTELSEAVSVASTSFDQPQPAPPGLDPAILEEILKYIEEQEEKDRKTCDGKETENEIDPAILDGILKSYFKKKAEKEEAQKICDGPETETGNKNGNKRQKGEKEKENGGQVEKKVVEENSERYEYPLRPEAGDCVKYLKTGTCKFGSNCNFNHPRGRKNPQVSKDKAKDRGESAKKPGQSECKVSKDKAKERGESVKKPGQSECKVSKDKAKERGESAKTPVQSKCKVSKDKAKERGELAKKPGQSECKVSMDKAKERGESAKKPGQSECKVSTDKAKEIGESAKKPGQSECKVSKDKAKERGELAKKPGQSECKVSKDKAKERGESVKKSGQSECKYFLSGTCNNGKACQFNHRREKLELNFLGLPIRPGKKDCWYYMKDGSCKYATNCMYNHPDPTAAEESDPPSRYGNGVPGSSQGASPPYVMNNSVIETKVYEQYPQQKKVEEFPERPGQPICTPFLRTGDCKFKFNCKYHHPKNQTAVSHPCELSDKGLPLRPDRNICTHYSHYGSCNVGAACKFDHPTM